MSPGDAKLTSSGLHLFADRVCVRCRSLSRNARVCEPLTITRGRPAQVRQARQPRAQLSHHRPRRLVRTSSTLSPLLPAGTNTTRSLAIIKRLISTLSVPDNLRREMKPPTWLESISKCKSRQIGPEQYRVEREAAGAVDPEKSEWVARVYECVALPPDLCSPGAPLHAHSAGARPAYRFVLSAHQSI